MLNFKEVVWFMEFEDKKYDVKENDKCNQNENSNKQPEWLVEQNRKRHKDAKRAVLITISVLVLSLSFKFLMKVFFAILKFLSEI